MSNIDMSKVLTNAKTIKVDETEYTLQKLPPRQALEIRDQWHIEGVPNEIKMFELILEHIVVKPQVSIDDFDDLVSLEKLVAEAMGYVYKSKGK